MLMASAGRVRHAAAIASCRMSRQRLLIVILPALVIGTIEALSDSLLDPLLPFPGDAILVTATVLVLSALLSGNAFNRIDALGATLALRNEKLERRAAAASALRRVSVAITAYVEPRQVLDAIVVNARELLGADVGLLLLLDADGRATYAAGSGPDGSIDPTGSRAPSGADDIERFVPPAVSVGRLVAPLQRGSETIGSLAVTARHERSFDVDDVETLASLATQAAIAIENARLQSRLRELAVETERERIAREMHDGLAQVLGYVRTKSQAIQELLAADRVADARTHLDELDAAARSIYVDVREAILGLRNPIAPELDLAGAIEQYAIRFAEASKLAVVVEVTPDARALGLDPGAEAQVFRIVQEGLTNARKHAGAERIAIHLDRIGSTLVVELHDDGRGFPTERGAAGDWPHYGLAAMRERASEIGARLVLANAPTGGGIVRLELPLHTAGLEAAS
jgi:signal transduction histidine kinase